MKKILFTLLLSIFLIPNANAEIQDVIYADYYRNSSSFNYYFTNPDLIRSELSNTLDKMYSNALTMYKETYSTNFPYYYISIQVISDTESISDSFVIYLMLHVYDKIPVLTDFSNVKPLDTYTSDYMLFTCTLSNNECTSKKSSYGIPLFNEYNSIYFFNPLAFYDSNFTLINNTIYDFLINKSDGSFYATYQSGDAIPSLITTINNRFVEVNLDNYEYVILNLKNYSKKDAFETNLQVKGSVAITPVYEFGTVEKEYITDLCNLSYSSFTDYRFFVLKNDLINNAVYIVKECSDSGSSFRFDSNVFDITYVTAENVDDPVVTFGGVEYHTIPFNKLSNTVNKNEEEGFIPGASGSSLTDIIDNISDFTSDIWNAISSFMGLVTKFFNTLPEEFRYLSITSFTLLTAIAIIKFIRG